jgi:hypothetical protein
VTISSISRIVSEDYVLDVEACAGAGGVPLVLWTMRADTNTARRLLLWKAHTTPEGQEVRCPLAVSFLRPTAIVADGVLVVAYESTARDPSVHVVRLDLATGAVLAGPTAVITRGARPRLVRPDSAADGNLLLAYVEPRGAVYLMPSFDGGVTWQSARAVLNNKVANTEDLVAVPFDGTHISLGQIGSGGRLLAEVASFSRTRPVTAIALSADRSTLYAVEATMRTGQITDNIRGRLVLTASEALASSRTRLGTADAYGDLIALPVPAMTAPASVVLASGAAPGGEIVRAPLAPFGAGAVVHTAGAGLAVVGLAVTATHAFYAAYGEAPAAGEAGFVRLADLVAGTFTPAGATRVNAVAVVNDRIVIAYTTAAGEWLGVGSVAAILAGGAVTSHVMPARVNAIAIAPGTTYTSIFVGLADRLNVYRYDDPVRPIRLLRSHILLTRGEVHHLVVAANGNVVGAMGAAGVMVFAPTGETRAQVDLSTLTAPEWRPGTAKLVGDFVRPTAASPYSAARRYFRCSRAGTTGAFEPQWGPVNGAINNPINDPSASGAGWTEQGSISAVATGVAIDDVDDRIYACAVLGGSTGTQGRIYLLDTQGLLA